MRHVQIAKSAICIRNKQQWVDCQTAADHSPKAVLPGFSAEGQHRTCVEAVSGDMTLPGYGMSDANLQRLQQETDIVIHAAASISFDDHIQSALAHNYMVGCTSCLPDFESCMLSCGSGAC